MMNAEYTLQSFRNPQFFTNTIRLGLNLSLDFRTVNRNRYKHQVYGNLTVEILITTSNFTINHIIMKLWKVYNPSSRQI